MEDHPNYLEILVQRICNFAEHERRAKFLLPFKVNNFIKNIFPAAVTEYSTVEFVGILTFVQITDKEIRNAATHLTTAMEILLPIMVVIQGLPVLFLKTFIFDLWKLCYCAVRMMT
uniref:Uncharacterized protein n=1 Tax=Micrurus spixii TaxID=129469 RepID=A0A2D4MTN3_9SAUR